MMILKILLFTDNEPFSLYQDHAIPVYQQHVTECLRADNYQQPQYPKANMADANLGTERYSLFMQIFSTDSKVWGMCTTE